MTDTALPETSSSELKFTDLNLSEPLLKSITEMGFVNPSPIQAQALPILLGESTDFLGLAATGTGKTAAFAIPLLEKIDTTVRSVQALVLCPTRELAIQVSEQINLLGRHMGVKSVPVYGGAGYRDQIRGIERGSPIVVGTPGRVQDHIDQGTLSLEGVSLVVLDEADEMISMGFRDAIESILNGVDPEYRNIWLFSATMSRDVRRVADEFLENPKQVEVNRKEMLPENIEQIYYVTQESNKPEVLCKLIEAADDFYGLIFCQTKALVADLYNFLQSRGYQVDSLHGDKDQSARERTLKAFRERNVTVLVCTDVAARGIDVKDVTHVINYSIPRELDSYVHRIGRTARSGKKGFAFSLIAPSQRSMIFRVERLTKRKLVEGRIPTRKEIGAKKVRGLLERMKGEKGGTRALALMGADWKEALEGLSAEDVAARFVALTFPDIFKEFEKAPAEQEGKAGKSASRKIEPVVLDGNQKLVLPEPPARSKPRFEERFDDEGQGRGPRGGRSSPWDRERGPRRGFSGRREEANYDEAPVERPARKSFAKPEFLKKDFERGFGGKPRGKGFARDAGPREGGGKKPGGHFRKDREASRPAPGKGGERALRRSDF